MIKTMKSYIITTLLCFSALTHTTNYWNWNGINTDTIQFPQGFLWGTSQLAYEIEGSATPNNTWHTHELSMQERSGIACDHWNRYTQDVQLMHQFGLNSCCLSLDWSAIEPTPGVFNKEALQHYADECDEYNHKGIMPIIILKDYRDPVWFIERGGFEKESNNAFFERYCLKVFNALSGKVFNYITFWAPESYAALAYWNKSHPPYKHSMQLTAQVFSNQLEAHVRVYNAIKRADTTQKVRIGIVKHMHRLEPWYKWDKLACRLADELTDEPFYKFFTTGVFKVRMAVPGTLNANVYHRNSLAPQSIDFIGINYHSHGYMKNFKKLSWNNPKEIPTDLPGFTIYAEGLFDSIKEVSERMSTTLNIPIYITQNGIATTSDTLRIVHSKRHLYAVSQAIKAGYNVQGYFYYSLLDGYTWGGYDKKFGLFDVNRITLERSIKPGAAYYLDIVNRFTHHV